MRIRVLGALEVEGVDARDLGSRKARTLLAALAAAQGSAVPTGVLVELLWSDAPPTQPADQLSVLVSRLRRVLGADRIARTDAGYSLRADWIDATELEARVDEAMARATVGSASAARAAAAAAVELVRGPLAVEETAPFFDVPRAVAERLAARARSMLAEAALASGDPRSAAAAAEATLDHDPYDEAALRTLMRAHVALGRPASALAAYAQTRERLADDLGVDLTADTEELHTRIVRGEEGAGLAADRPSALVGRGRELGVLRDALDQAAAGTTRAVEIEGEAGMGKSALLDAFTSSVEGALVLTGRCDALGRELPLQPLLDGLERQLRQAEDAVALLGDEASALGPLVGHLAVSPASAVTTVRDAEHGQAVLFRAILSVVERLAAGRPIAIVVDDTHLAGRSTIEWLRFAFRRGERLLVLTARRPIPQQEPTVVGGQRHVLGPLDRVAAAVLVGDDRTDELLARSGGNPLLLVELAAAVGDSVPDSIRELVAQRADALGDDAASTVRAAALLGQKIDVDLLAGVLERPLDQLLDELEAAETARLVGEHGGALRFTHDLVREVLAASVSVTRTAHLHRRAASLLAARPAHDPLAVALHAQGSGDSELAASALVDAGRYAADRFDLTEAARLLDAALDLADIIDARLARARVRMAAWELTGARSDAERAIELGGDARAFELAGWIAYYQRAHDDARRFADEALVRATDPALRASCLALVGRWCHTRGELREASAALEEGLAIAPPDVRGVPAIWLAGVRAHQGRLSEAADLAASSALGADRIDHPFAPLHALFTGSVALGAQGNVSAALATLDRLDALVRREGAQARRFEPVARNVRGWLLRNVGRLDEADDLNEEAAHLPADEPAFAEPRYVGHLDLVEGRFAAGDLDGAAELLDGIVSIEQWEGSMAWHQRERYRLQRARLAFAAGDLALADDLATAVESDARERGCRRYEVLAGLVVAAAAGDRSRVEVALDHADELAALEVWWLTADLAAALEVDAWWPDAERRVERLARGAGPLGDELRVAARDRLTRLRR